MSQMRGGGWYGGPPAGVHRDQVVVKAAATAAGEVPQRVRGR